MSHASKIAALVVEDDPTLAELAVEMVESLGHTAHCADCQQAASELVDATRIDYVLLDLEIPLRTGRMARVECGFNLLAHISALPAARRPGVIVMTAHGDDHEYCRRAFRVGADDFLKKPFDAGSESPEACIRRLLRDRSERLSSPETATSLETPATVRAPGPALHLIGTYENRRCALQIDGRLIQLPEQRFRLLAYLAAQAKRKPGEPLALLDVPEARSGPRQAINRLKKDLHREAPEFWDSVVRSDGHGGYFLRIEPTAITYDAEAMRAHALILDRLHKT